jgi:hypothetical protein
MTQTLPDLRRLRYFHGQMLGAHDFQREQAYFREKLKLRNRCLHGYGVCCGLKVEAVSPAWCKPQDERARAQLVDRLAELEARLASTTDERQRRRLEAEMEDDRRELDKLPPPTECPLVRLTAGVALDCLGNEIVVAHPCELDLWRLLSPDDRRRFRPGDPVYLSIAYHDRPVEPTRGVFADGCGNGSDCEYGWSRDDYTVCVTLQPPGEEECEDLCCETCEDPQLLLARIDDVHAERAVTQAAIHMEVRRPLSLHRLVTITGISWIHDGVYTIPQAKQVLGTDDPGLGLVVRFSRRVRTSTLVDGVVDVQVVQGGRGRSGYPYFMQTVVVRPSGDYTDTLRFRQTSREGVEVGDRVLITVRTAFILDHCCQPVDGTHVGGRVPQLPDYQPRGQAPTDCAVPPGGIRPWRSGTGGTGGDVFESWFTIGEEKEATP